MENKILEKTPDFLNVLGLDEEPMGLFFTDEKPEGCLSPKPNDLPTKAKEEKNEIDWPGVFGKFSCVIGHIWRARKKKIPACFSAQEFGCPGASFWVGFNKPQTETIIGYVSEGIPNFTEGERYCKTHDDLRRVFTEIDPVPAPKPYCVVKPLSLFKESEEPEFVLFFTRPESLAGLHQMAFFVTNDPEVVVSPWSAACGSIAAWPMKYKARGEAKAVVGGWDPSARKFFKTDELSFTVPYSMYVQMIEQYQESFLTTKTWSTVRKKIGRSKKAWSE
ncbi:protein of unknown function DUF169 [Desulfatibacillum aliphaticivorans]|uniref:DUF169 domain-containing protein n=1 Tax=Desulfatibacillum aliphaticivorans TaxID=218208 RepID=B8FL20_DESAL|nr:DUF169 domain-containing protein [Desulfatibacillum aliphaticivorans]ACL04655.1 protein of unknown function DUF169 [Desulfatibacillum aliphaticivorans]